MDATGRAAAELAQFQDRDFGDDVDPDAPAAMKDSPSVSGDDAAGELHSNTHNHITLLTQQDNAYLFFLLLFFYFFIE